MELQDFAPIFGEPKVEWLNRGLLHLHPFLFHVHTPNPSHLRFCVTDFHSNTWESTKSALQLDDMRDDIGIGGAMSEFVHYIITSLKFGDVRLCMEGQSGKDGATGANLIAQKSKGMPVFSISLTKLMHSAASEAMATLSLGLFNSLKDKECSLVKEQERSLRLTTMISTEKEKYESIQSQLGQYTKKQKLQNMSASNSPDKSVGLNIGSTKVTNRVVPAHRRVKTRGALLQDSEDDNEQERSLQSASEQEEKKQELQNTNASANVDGFQKSHDKPVDHDIASTKVTNHVVPAHRRGRTRGALLQDNEDENGRNVLIDYEGTSMSEDNSGVPHTVRTGSASQFGSQSTVSGGKRRRSGRDPELMDIFKSAVDMQDNHLMYMRNWQIQKNDIQSKARGDALEKISSLTYLDDEEQATLVDLVASDYSKVLTFLQLDERMTRSYCARILSKDKSQRM